MAGQVEHLQLKNKVNSKIQKLCSWVDGRKERSKSCLKIAYSNSNLKMAGQVEHIQSNHKVNSKIMFLGGWMEGSKSCLKITYNKRLLTTIVN